MSESFQRAPPPPLCKRPIPTGSSIRDPYFSRTHLSGRACLFFGVLGMPPPLLSRPFSDHHAAGAPECGGNLKTGRLVVKISPKTAWAGGVSRARSGHQISCCSVLVSLHFLCDILCMPRVELTSPSCPSSLHENPLPVEVGGNCWFGFYCPI